MNFLEQKQPSKLVVGFSASDAEKEIANFIFTLINTYGFNHWVIVCIGTDRSTGDSLGPLVGSKLKLNLLPGIKVFGTLEEPVHALNLPETIKFVKETFPNSGILAIDASLGRLNSVGTIQILEGPVKPGAGVKKELPEIGHFHITGIVNVGGFMEYFVLQNTRLSLVIKMAEIISDAISMAFQSVKYNKENAI